MYLLVDGGLDLSCSLGYKNQKLIRTGCDYMQSVLFLAMVFGRYRHSDKWYDNFDNDSRPRDDPRYV